MAPAYHRRTATGGLTMYQRMAAMAAFSCLILATPALAAPGHHHKAADAPCDADVGAFDETYEVVAFTQDHSYFPQEEQARPDKRQAAPDADDDSDDADDAGSDDGDDDGDSGNQGCAEIMVTPYDIMIHAPDTQPLPVVLRREHLVRKAELI